jgi:hypothetical protein
VATTEMIAAPNKAIAGLQNISAVMQSMLRRVVEPKKIARTRLQRLARQRLPDNENGYSK